MEICFVRHGVPDYSLSDARKMSQLEKDYAPLSRAHIPAVHEVAQRVCHHNAQVILSSPYTRALQTAEIINRGLGLELFVEHDLREWRADLAGGYISLAERDRRWHEHRQSLKLKTTPKPDCDYESWPTLSERVTNVLARYQDYARVIVVAHFNVYEALAGFQEEPIACAGERIFRFQP